MNILNLCGPVVLYLGFSLIQIIIDIFREHYNVALLKFIVMIVFATVLNILCSKNLSVVAWLIVFIPFIFMTVITTLLLMIFGLDPKLGKIKVPDLNKNLKKIEKEIGKEIGDNLNNKNSPYKLGKSIGIEIGDNIHNKKIGKVVGREIGDNLPIFYSNSYKSDHHH